MDKDKTPRDPYSRALDEFEELLDNAVANHGGEDEPSHYDHELRDQINILRAQRKKELESETQG